MIDYRDELLDALDVNARRIMTDINEVSTLYWRKNALLDEVKALELSDEEMSKYIYLSILLEDEKDPPDGEKTEMVNTAKFLVDLAYKSGKHDGRVALTFLSSLLGKIDEKLAAKLQSEV